MAVAVILAVVGACSRASDATPQGSDSPHVIPAPHASGASTPINLAPGDTNTVVVYKSPTCGCCAKWVEHLQSAGFNVVVRDTADVDVVKDDANVPLAVRSCHTALAAGYVIEGHVPAADIRRLLHERPAVAGVAVPGMPVGSPGMEGGRGEAYDVVTFGGRGAPIVFAHH